MTLGTHTVVGAAAATLFPGHPVIGFVVGFMSHFLLDAIPHWDYKILSSYASPDAFEEMGGQTKFDDKFWLDIFRIGFDVLLGVAVALLLFSPHTYNDLLLMAMGGFGAVLPDFLQFVYMRFPYQPLVALQKFHGQLMHAKTKIVTPFWGVTTQVLFIGFVFVLVKYLGGL